MEVVITGNLQGHLDQGHHVRLRRSAFLRMIVIVRTYDDLADNSEDSTKQVSPIAQSIKLNAGKKKTASGCLPTRGLI